MSDKTAATKTAQTNSNEKTHGTSEAIYNKLKDMKDAGVLVCKKCKSKARTDLDGNLFCPVNDSSCPLTQIKGDEFE